MDWSIILFFLVHLVIMMFIMRRHSNGEGKKHVQNSSVNSQPKEYSTQTERLENYKIKQLEGELELLKGQNESLRKKLNDMTDKNQIV